MTDESRAATDGEVIQRKWLNEAIAAYSAQFNKTGSIHIIGESCAWLLNRLDDLRSETGPVVDRNAVLEEAARIAEGGRFLHNEAPDARFGKACAAAIRALKLAAPQEGSGPISGLSSTPESRLPAESASRCVAVPREYIAGLQRAWSIVNGRKAGRDASDEIWRELTKIEHIIEQEENYAATIAVSHTEPKDAVLVEIARESWERYNNWMRAAEPWFVLLVIFSPMLLLAAVALINQ